MSRTLLPLAVLVFAAGCSEYDLTSNPDANVGPAPDIKVAPAALQYGELSDGQEEVKSFTVENIGEADLYVSDITVAAGEGSFTVVTQEREFMLAPGETTTVDVAFTPMGVENYGTVHVHSDDPDSPEAPVDLLGLGAVPELAITPQHWTFSDTPIPCGDGIELELANIGSELLTITEFDYESGGLLSLDASGVQLPITLAPGENTFVNVNFAAVDIGSDTGVLAVTSNDPRGVVEADQNGEGAYDSETTESFAEPGIPPVDVMFLIDQSCSMEGDNTDDIEAGIPGFITELQNVSDWQLIQITKESGCANGGILDVTTPNPSTLLINNAWNYTNAATYYTEALLQLASIALAQTGPGGCNEGFLRPGALLHIIVASDEKEQSGTNWSTWLTGYEGYVSAPELVKVSAIADLNTNCGDGSGGAGYEEIADATGGVKLNICNSNWGSNMTAIASDVLAGIQTYNLTDSAVEGSIEVLVDGVATTDFDYNADSNSVTVNSPTVSEGGTVEVTYGVMAECN